MRTLIVSLVVSLAAAALWFGCGGECSILLSGGLVVGCGDEPPGPGDPAFGSAAEVLVEDCDTGQLLWVGIAAPPTPTPPPVGGGRAADVFDDLEALRCAGELNWIGGEVQVAEDHPNGFFFDPLAIIVLPTAPPEIQTTIAAIARDPEFFAPDGGGGEDFWVIPATIAAIETTQPLECPVTPACGVQSSLSIRR